MRYLGAEPWSTLKVIKRILNSIRRRIGYKALPIRNSEDARTRSHTFWERERVPIHFVRIYDSILNLGVV